MLARRADRLRHSGGLAGNATLFLGPVALVLLWAGPLPELAQTSFLAHMLLHLGVVVVAGPLIGYAIASRLPDYPTVRDAFSWCLLGSMLELVIVWGWHVPVLHDVAATDGASLVAEQSSFLIAGTAIWTAAFLARDRRTAGAAALALFLTFSHMTMFGLLLTIAPNLLYDPSLCGGLGISKLDDQRLGGILMAVGGGLPYFLGCAWACWVMIRPDGKHEEVLQGWVRDH